MYRSILIYVGVDGSFGGFDYRLAKWIIVFLKDDGEGHFHTRNADIILQHTAFYEVFARTRVADML